MIKFLLQTINNELVHDFTFTLKKSIEYHDWLQGKNNPFSLSYSNEPNIIDCIPIGSVEFVINYLQNFHNKIPKPINIPIELFDYEFTGRKIVNCTKKEIIGGKFVKSNDIIKGITGHSDLIEIPNGNYQMSDIVDIESEYRVFVYQDKIVGLQHYSGDYFIFPNKEKIVKIIQNYKSSPIAYSLDVGITKDNETIIIEIHDMFSVGLYGFNDHSVLPFMFSRWWHNYINNINWKENKY